MAVRLDGGIGDVLLAMPVLAALFDALVRCEIDVFYFQPEAARFATAGARFVRAVHPAAGFAAAERRYDLSVRPAQFVRYGVRDAAKLARVAPDFAARLNEAAARLEAVRGLADRHPALDGLWGRLCVQAGRNVLDTAGFLGALPVDRHTPLWLAPDPAALALLDARVGPPGTRYVTLHDGFDNSTPIPAGAATKCWPLERWAAFVAGLRARHPDVRVVQVGARRSRAIPGVDVDLVDRTSLAEAAWVVKHALVHVDTDSGLAHLARAVHAPAVVLFGPTDAGYYGHPGHANLAPARCGNCWWSTPDWLARCPRGLARPECVESIAPEVVVEEASRRIAAARPLAATAGPVACYDGALCRDGAPVLAALCDALELPPLPPTAHIRSADTGVHIHASKQWEYLWALRALDGVRVAGGPLRVADLGGGRGALAPWLARRGDRVEVYDVDYQWDHGGDATVEWRYRRQALDAGYRAAFGSLYNVPAPSGAYDAVTCISVVEHVPHKAYVLAEALRLLRPGGVLVLTFDLATAPERFEDGMRREIFGPARIAATLARLGLEAPPLDPADVERSARAIHADGVCGIPEGMTVGGMVIRKGGAR